MRTSRWRWLPLLLILLVQLCLPAWGRAGGGDQYTPGGGDSGYSGGSGSGGDDLGLIWFLLRLAFDYPVIGVPLLVLFVVVVLMRNNSARGTPLVTERGMTRTIVQGLAAQQSQRMGDAAQRIRQRDAGFDEQSFLARAGDAFRKIQQAWSGQDMAPARAFISDGVMERFAIQIEMQKAAGIRNDMTAVNVLDAAIVEAESDAHFDTLHVRIRANAVDTKVSLADGRRVSGSGQMEPFTEVWTFLRRPGAQTLARPGLLEGYCPSCGAPLNIADAAQCGSCKAWVNSGQYDWVLSEITQDSEWAVRGSGAAVPGFTALAQRDALLNTQALEDRASVAFWRWQRALAQNKPAALLPVALPGYCEAWAQDAQARRWRYEDAAVGAVEVRALQTAQDSNTGMELAHVAVRWSGLQFDTASGAAGGQQLREHVFVLGRRPEARTDQDAGLNSCRCPNCGAPPASRDEPKCTYCGTPFNDGSRQWVITAILPIAQWRMPGASAATAPQALAAELPAEPAVSLGWVQNLSGNEVLTVLVAAMLADGEMSPAERKLLDRYARNNHVDPAAVESVIAAVRGGQLDIPKAGNELEARACLNGLIEMSLADGKVDPAELKLILRYAEGNGIARDKVIQRIKERRLELYRDAQAG